MAEVVFAEGLDHDKSGRCADAARCYEQAVALGHVPAYAPLAMMLSGPLAPLIRAFSNLTCCGSGGSDEREGVAQDKARSMQLLQHGAQLGCNHCKGILGGCYLFGEGVDGDHVRGSELLKESIAAASPYGQCVNLFHDCIFVTSGAGTCSLCATCKT
jgi:TPR repeat protein